MITFARRVLWCAEIHRDLSMSFSTVGIPSEHNTSVQHRHHKAFSGCIGTTEPAEAFSRAIHAGSSLVENVTVWQTLQQAKETTLNHQSAVEF